MANIKKAMEWLKEGKKITRPNWEKESYLVMGEDYSIKYSDGTKAYFYPNQILACNWKVFEEEKTLSDKIYSSLNLNTGETAPNWIKIEDLKKSIKNLKSKLMSNGCGMLIYIEGDAPINQKDVYCGQGCLCYQCRRILDLINKEFGDKLT